MKSCGVSSEFAACIASEILYDYLSKVNLDKLHRIPQAGRFRRIVSPIDKNAHPLVSRAVCIDRPAYLAGRLYLYSLTAGLHGIVGIVPLNNQVGMAVEELILRQGS